MTETLIRGKACPLCAPMRPPLRCRHHTSTPPVRAHVIGAVDGAVAVRMPDGRVVLGVDVAERGDIQLKNPMRWSATDAEDSPWSWMRRPPPPPLTPIVGCDPAADHCRCELHTPALTWSMHWRPDMAPPAPWRWLDNRPRGTVDVHLAQQARAAAARGARRSPERRRRRLRARRRLHG